VRPVGPGGAEVVVEDFLENGPGHFGVGAEVRKLQQSRVVLRPQATGAAEGRDAALDADRRAREGGEMTGAIV
jgi:hypothetical protein